MTNTTSTPFDNFTLGKEIRILPDLQGPGFFTYNPQLKRLSYFKESEGVGPEKEKELQNTIETLENELDKMYENSSKFSLEDFDEKKSEIYNKKFELRKAQPGEYRAAYIYFATEEEIAQRKDIAMNSKEPTVYSVAYETGYRGKNSKSEPANIKVNWGWTIEY